ncbi:MAG: hypothetical protein O2800_04975 [Planctomycetota bacterium]|nr:hypothetical protein [Planctomycetota bacterium]
MNITYLLLVLRTCCGIRIAAIAFAALASLSAHGQDTAPATIPTVKATAPAPTLDELLKLNAIAMGGSDKLNAIKNITMTGTMSMGGAGMTGALTQQIQLPGKLLLNLDLPGIGKVSTGCDGTVGWSMNPMMGPTLMDDADLDTLKLDTIQSFAPDLRSIYDTVTSNGLQPFEGATAIELVCVRGESTSRKFFDPSTFLQVGQIDRVKSMMGEVESVTVMNEYKPFEGIQVPVKTTIKVMGQSQVVSITAVQFDPILDSVFVLPPEIQTLAAQRSAKQPTAPAAPTTKP